MESPTRSYFRFAFVQSPDVPYSELQQAGRGFVNLGRQVTAIQFLNGSSARPWRYCAWSGDVPRSLTTGGGLHLPVRASILGA
jgi:hypothetical protein